MRSGRHLATALFFPSAAVVALAVVAAKVSDYAGLSIGLAQPLSADWHGHEMLFGYAYAVIGGYLLTQAERRYVVLAYAAWLAGRLAHLVFPLPGLAEAALALTYPLLLFLLAGIPFLRAAKKGRNVIFAPIVGLLGLAELVYQLEHRSMPDARADHGLLLAMNMVMLLLFTMGGRIIAAATSGAHQALGKKVQGVAQAPLERAGVILIALMTILDATGLAPRVTGGLAVAAGAVVAWRLAGWRVWRVWRAAEAAVLHLGYGWLGAGLILVGVAGLTGQMSIFDAAHAPMVGGLGTLSIAMMTRTTQQRLRLPIAVPRLELLAVGLLSAAALARTLALEPGIRIECLWVAAAAWVLAFALVVAYLSAALVRNLGPG